MNREIEKSAPGANGLYFLPYLIGERAPRWNPEAKGAFIGLKAENTRGDMLRSIPEGITMNLAVCLDILKSHVGIEEMTVVGGGARGRILFFAIIPVRLSHLRIVGYKRIIQMFKHLPFFPIQLY